MSYERNYALVWTVVGYAQITAEISSGGTSEIRVTDLVFFVESVVMASTGPGHIHSQGEIDLCLPISGRPSFDGRTDTWVVMP